MLSTFFGGGELGDNNVLLWFKNISSDELLGFWCDKVKKLEHTDSNFQSLIE